MTLREKIIDKIDKFLNGEQEENYHTISKNRYAERLEALEMIKDFLPYETYCTAQNELYKKHEWHAYFEIEGMVVQHKK